MFMLYISFNNVSVMSECFPTKQRLFKCFIHGHNSRVVDICHIGCPIWCVDHNEGFGISI